MIRENIQTDDVKNLLLLWRLRKQIPNIIAAMQNEKSITTLESNRADEPYSELFILAVYQLFAIPLIISFSRAFLQLFHSSLAFAIQAYSEVQHKEILLRVPALMKYRHTLFC